MCACLCVCVCVCVCVGEEKGERERKREREEEGDGEERGQRREMGRGEGRGRRGERGREKEGERDILCIGIYTAYQTIIWHTCRWEIFNGMFSQWQKTQVTKTIHLLDEQNMLHII